MHKIIEKWKKLSYPAKSSIVFLIAIIFTKGIVFITTPIFTRIMSEADMGVVGSYNSWKGIYECFSIFSITSAGVFNVGMSQYRECRDKYISSIIGFCFVSASICGVFVILFYDQLKNIVDLPKSLVVLLVLYSLIMPAQTFWISKQRYEYKYKAAFFAIVFTTLIGQLNAIFAVYISNSNLSEVRLWATAMVDFPVGVFFIILFIKRNHTIFNKSIWKHTLFFAAPLIPHYLSSIVLTASDRIMVFNLDSPDHAGIYTVAYGIAAIGSIVWGAIQGSLTPYIFDKLDTNTPEGISELCEKMIIIFGVISLFISLFAPEIMRIMGPSSYSIGAYIIPAVVGSIFISCLYNLFSLIAFYYKKAGYIAFASCVAAVVNLVLNYYLIPMFGFIAAGYTTLAAYIVLSIMHYINMRRIEKYNIYNGKKMWIICIGILILCILSVLLYDWCIVRYVICIVLITILILNRKTIRKVLERK